jgi:hypothetical protein
MSHTNGSLALNGNGHRPYTNGNGTHRDEWWQKQLARNRAIEFLGKTIQILLIVSISGFAVYGLWTKAHEPIQPPTSEEKIKADRLHKIDAAIEVLQDERDEIEPPIEYEPDPPGWP